jgi:glycosyltransferase involved in cell wall biosynthesis
MIKICHLISGLETGGAEMMLYKLLSGIDRERFEPSVVSLIDRGRLGERIEGLGIPVQALGMRAGRPTAAGLARLFRRAREFKPDLLQGWMYHGNLAATLASRCLPARPPVLWNVRQTLYDPAREKRLTRWVILLSARLSGTTRSILYNSRLSAEQHEALGFHGGRRMLLGNGFDCAAFAPAPEVRRRWRASHGYAEADSLIGLAARYHPMKDHGNFLRAAAGVAARHAGARFVLAGKGVDADNRALAALLGELNLSERTRLLGECPDMAGFFQSLDIAALASAWGEGFPNVLGEAMACGVPCVATEVGDSAEIVGATGRIVPPRDPEALAAALGEMIDLGGEARARLGERARERVLAHYALPGIVARYEALYAEAVAERNSANRPARGL